MVTANPGPKQSPNKWLHYAGATAAMTILILFLIGILDIITLQSLQFTTTNSLAVMSSNWLIVMLKMNMGWSNPGLNVINALDLSIMALFCVLFLALYSTLRQTSKVLSVIMVCFPFLGIPLFIATGSIGRSTLLVGGLLASLVMLKSKTFTKTTAYIGIIASVILFFIGDLATAFIASSNIIALCILTGYVLWIAWFLLIAKGLLQFERRRPKGESS